VDLMRRVGNLWQELTSFANLLRAAKQSARGKRFQPAVLAFHDRLEPNLCRLQDALRGHTWGPGPFRQFTITDPKKRIICAAPYPDRVVHHALVNVLEPIWERSFLPDSYASRKGKGTHAAMRRCQHFARRWGWVWKADVRHFFPNIDHTVLEGLLARKVKDSDVRRLAGVIIAHSPLPEEPPTLFPGDDLFTHAERRRGLPIGNQTSQFFANVYLDPLDHFVKQELRLPGYIRYVDDFVAFAPSKQALVRARVAVADFLAGLRLRLHPTKNAIFPVRQGIRFVGYRVWPTHVKLPAQNVHRFRRRLRHLAYRYFQHEIDWPELACRVTSWFGHACQADTWRLRQGLLDEHLYRRASAR
jgi:retron-type reverse transcriptase